VTTPHQTERDAHKAAVEAANTACFTARQAGDAQAYAAAMTHRNAVAKAYLAWRKANGGRG
jgi:hypothetical protein